MSEESRLDFHTSDEETGSSKGREGPYSVGKIKQLLKSAMNMRGVKVEDHFAEKELFLDRSHVQ